ncbi:hypothetical protein BEP19_14195 [Ammoniphilus oxalaticus]|uniref:Transposase zinc-ribbon domain-containing protein n=1 Tax=Ammoniphilus oxalaticus TaxID=66863 RepID=A0A419SEK6_9BACL|nr:transposase [Ammoniphilus oxalaticus]RKD21769.1 hypothetical protein BEP19_14195 [Ammoniphilus oxalaticus]
MLQKRDFFVNQNVRLERLQQHFNRFKKEETCRHVLNQLIIFKQKQQHKCPHCASVTVVRYGKYRDRQRYKCKECCRTFNDLTNTPLHYTHSPYKWIQFIYSLICKQTLAFSSSDVDICYSTAYFWRHKIIHALAHVNPDPKQTILIHSKYPYLCVRQHPPQLIGDSEDGLKFTNWIQSFQWIARRFVDRYLAWFQFLEKLDTDSDLDKIKFMLFSACSQPLLQTYNTIKIKSPF